MTHEEILRQQLQYEQAETARELAELLRLAQEIGRRLSNETHGELYDEVRQLIALLHQSRTQADLIDAKLNAIDEFVPGMMRQKAG